jgi:hypothetical protein
MNKVAAAKFALQIVTEHVKAGQLPNFSGEPELQGKQLAAYLAAMTEALSQRLLKLDE